MKLTASQISTIRFALAEAAEKHQERAGRAPEGTFWKEEAESATALSDLFKDALSVEVESVQLEPAKDACGDIHCRSQCDDRPPFIVLIDAAGSEDAAAWCVANAVPSALRAAARFLQVDMHSLPNAITKRVRTRLQQAA
ncbi:MAG: hypothetical protein WAW39_17090 [Prosthecobacter sp.]|uniref:hypothetical protein n=1 Tax=Prosthecobacter sp. TaxID=1965333 RepID=UPI003BB058D9